MDGPEFIDSELHRSAAAGEAADVRDQILNEGVDVNIKGAGERRPLHRAAGNGHYSASKTLLDVGAEVNARDRQGRTPLHYAALKGSADVVKLLIDSGALVNARSKTGATSLHYAAEKGYDETVEVLRTGNADASLLDSEGLSAGFYAERAGHKKLAKLLKVNTTKSSGARREELLSRTKTFAGLISITAAGFPIPERDARPAGAYDRKLFPPAARSVMVKGLALRSCLVVFAMMLLTGFIANSTGFFPTVGTPHFASPTSDVLTGLPATYTEQWRSIGSDAIPITSHTENLQLIPVEEGGLLGVAAFRDGNYTAWPSVTPDIAGGGHLGPGIIAPIANSTFFFLHTDSGASKTLLAFDAVTGNVTGDSVSLAETPVGLTFHPGYDGVTESRLWIWSASSVAAYDATNLTAGASAVLTLDDLEDDEVIADCANYHEPIVGQDESPAITLDAKAELACVTSYLRPFTVNFEPITLEQGFSLLAAPEIEIFPELARFQASSLAIVKQDPTHATVFVGGASEGVLSVYPGRAHHMGTNPWCEDDEEVRGGVALVNSRRREPFDLPWVRSGLGPTDPLTGVSRDEIVDVFLDEERDAVDIFYRDGRIVQLVYGEGGTGFTGLARPQENAKLFPAREINVLESGADIVGVVRAGNTGWILFNNGETDDGMLYVADDWERDDESAVPQVVFLAKSIGCGLTMIAMIWYGVLSFNFYRPEPTTVVRSNFQNTLGFVEWATEFIQFQSLVFLGSVSLTQYSDGSIFGYMPWYMLWIPVDRDQYDHSALVYFVSLCVAICIIIFFLYGCAMVRGSQFEDSTSKFVRTACGSGAQWFVVYFFGSILFMPLTSYSSVFLTCEYRADGTGFLSAFPSVECQQWSTDWYLQVTTSFFIVLGYVPFAARVVSDGSLFWYRVRILNDFDLQYPSVFTNLTMAIKFLFVYLILPFSLYAVRFITMFVFLVVLAGFHYHYQPCGARHMNRWRLLNFAAAIWSLVVLFDYDYDIVDQYSTPLERYTWLLSGWAVIIAIIYWRSRVAAQTGGDDMSKLVSALDKEVDSKPSDGSSLYTPQQMALLLGTPATTRDLTAIGGLEEEDDSDDLLTLRDGIGPGPMAPPPPSGIAAAGMASVGPSVGSLKTDRSSDSNKTDSDPKSDPTKPSRPKSSKSNSAMSPPLPPLPAHAKGKQRSSTRTASISTLKSHDSVTSLQLSDNSEVPKTLAIEVYGKDKNDPAGFVFVKSDTTLEEVRILMDDLEKAPKTFIFLKRAQKLLSASVLDPPPKPEEIDPDDEAMLIAQDFLPAVLIQDLDAVADAAKAAAAAVLSGEPVPNVQPIYEDPQWGGS